MKIFIVGQFEEGSLCSSYLRSFRQLGCEVSFFDELQEYRNVSAFTGQRYLNKALETWFTMVMNKKLIEETRNYAADLWIIIKGQRILPETISKIKKEKRAIFFNINPDDPFNKNRGASSENVRKALKKFDCYFIWSKNILKKLKQARVQRTEYLPFAFDPTISYPLQISSEDRRLYGHDLVFLGNWEARREKWLRYLKDLDLAIWGGVYWKQRCRDRGVIAKWQGREIEAKDISKVFNASKISLNILRKQNLGSINMRTFEVAASGAFVLAERSEEAKEFFKEDEEAVYFSTAEELKEKVRYYLAHEELRNRIAQNGYQRCIFSNYSYLGRAKFILDIYDKYFSYRIKIKTYRVALAISHPIQYLIPLYQKIIKEPRINLTVYFFSTFGIKKEYCKEFRTVFKWDRLDLNNINYKVLRNYSPFPSTQTKLGLINFGIIKELITGNYDAVFIPSYGALTYLMAFLTAYFAKIPIILSGEPRFPVIKRKIKQKLLRFLFSKVSAFCYVGKRARDFYKFYGIPDKKLFFTPYCVDNDFLLKESQDLQFKKEQLKEETGLPLENPIILYIAKINKNKHPFDLLEAYRNLSLRATLLFVGDGPLLMKLKKQVNAKKIENVFFSGFQNYSQIGKYYAVSDILVLPSAGESWGVVINEAMCFGLPIITTDKVMSAYDLVHQDENGYLLPVGDITALTKALEELLASPDKRKRMGEKSRQIISNFNYGIYVDGLLKAVDFIYKK